MKTLRFIGSTREDLADFPKDARCQAGYQLWRVQVGMEPEDWKPMADLGDGVREIRIHVEGEWRVVYVAHLADAVYVLHCFSKKTAKTPVQVLELIRKRYRQIGDK